MDEKVEKDQEVKEENGWEVVGKILVGVIVIFGMAIAGLIVWGLIFGKVENVPTKGENAFVSYKSAVKLCGIDNVRQHDYTDGTTDFDCRDYSIVK
jgi:hypothetical protein